jgi:hypothetical protein
MRATFGRVLTAVRRVLMLLLCPVLVLLSPHPSHGHKPLVLFDQGHGQRFAVEDSNPLGLSRLAEVLREEGAQVGTLTGRIDNASLAAAKALVISGPFASFEEPEVEAIAAFVMRGGRVTIMLHIAPPATSLLDGLGVTSSMGVINEVEATIGDVALNFYVLRMERHPLTSGLKNFAVYGGWAVQNMGRNAIVIARTGPGAWLDANGNRVYDLGEPVESMGVVVAGRAGSGSFLVFGDDAIFQNKFLEGSNLALARNLAEWLLKEKVPTR